MASTGAIAQSSSGRIAHWMLNGNGADSSGNGLHGTVYGATPDTGRNMKPNSAMRFGGTSYIQIPYSSLFNTAQFSIAAIVKLDNFYSGACQMNAVFWRGNEFQNGAYAMVVFDNAFDSSCTVMDTSKNVFAGSISTNTHQLHSAWQYNPTVKRGRWYSAVLTYDGTTAKVFVNGVHMSTNVLGNPVNTSTEGALIGLRYANNGAYPYSWDGLIDDIQLYDRVLTDSEVLSYHVYDTARPVPLDTTTTPTDTTTTPVDTTSSLGLGYHNASPFKVFPNPAADMLNISGAGTAEADIAVINTLGQVMYRKNAGQSVAQIPTGSWPRGHYVVRVTSRGVTLHRKVLLQ